MMVLDIQGRNTDTIPLANALADWLRQPRIGQAVMRRGILSQPSLVMVWAIVAEYAQAKVTPETAQAAEDFVRDAARRILADRPVRRVIAATCVKQGATRRAAMASMMRWETMLTERAESAILRPN